jgi:hypothetical protein
MALDVLFEVLAAALFFFVPGFFLLRALFPEWRMRGEGGREHALVLFTGGIVLSVVLTILIGFYLGNVGLFQAGMSDPLLEEILGGLSLIFLVVGIARGAFAPVPPPPSRFVEVTLPGEDDGAEFLAELAEMGARERRLRHEIRKARREGSRDLPTLESQLSELLARRGELERSRDQMLRKPTSGPD